MKTKTIIKNTSSNSSLVAYIKGYNPAIPINLGTALFPICLGQEYHEGEKLKALIDLLQSFKKIVVLVSGLLYRHTIQLTESLEPKQACEEAIRRGEEWENTCKSIIETTNTPTDVYKWEFWLLHEKYAFVRQQLEKFMIQADFREAFYHEANLFINRLKKKYKIEDDIKALSFCLNYLKEECTVFVLMHRFDHYTHFVYPGLSSKAIIATFEYFKLQVDILRPEFMSTNHKPVHYNTSSITHALKLQIILELDNKAIFLEDVSDVLSNCKVFFLKKAARFTRDKVAAHIESHVMRNEAHLKLYKKSNAKTTILIFAPQNKYPATKFDHESCEKYIPSAKIDLRDVDFSNSEYFPTGGVIDLRPLENDEAKKCSLLISSIETRGITNYMDEIVSKEIYEAIEFIYSYLVYNTDAPEAKFYIITNDKSLCKLYYSYPDSAIDKGAELRQITEYLIKLAGIDSNFADSLVETEIILNTESRSVFRIFAPFIFLNHIFKLFSALRESKSLESTPPSSDKSNPSVVYESFNSMDGMILEGGIRICKAVQPNKPLSPRTLLFSSATNQLKDNTPLKKIAPGPINSQRLHLSLH